MNRPSDTVHYPPGPRPLNPLRNLLAIRRDIIGFLTRVAEQYGDIAYFKVGPLRVALLSHPDHVQDVLVTNHRNFVKGRPLQLAKQLLGEGLLTSEGDLHARQRKVIMPAFHRKRIDAYGKVMTGYATQLSGRWRNGSTVDIAHEMMQMAMAIAGKTLFDRGVDSDEAKEIGEAFTSAMSLFSRVSIPLAEWLLKLPLPSSIRFRKAKKRLDAMVYQMISERRRSGQHHEDILSALLLAQSEQSEREPITDEQVRDEVLTLFLTALDTTSLALTWTWYLISQHPGVETTLHDELDAILGGRSPTVEDLPRLTYTRSVLSEAMRLYPPLYVIARQALNDYDVGEYTLPAGCLVLMSPYLMHRDPRYHPDPYTFDPQQWDSETRASCPKFAYFPFGGGSRACIGESFAWMEGVLVLATLAQHWSMRLAPGHRVELEPLINLRPRYGMRMILQRRT